jgi:hypothetical protein
MNSQPRKTLVPVHFISNVPFNYMIVKFQVKASSEEKLDVVNGRHIERTFQNINIQNTSSRKQYFYKPISRYGVKL